MSMDIEVKIVDSMEAHDHWLMRQIEEDRITTPIRGLVMTAETFSQIFTPERIKLLRYLHQNPVKSIYQLAKDLGKPYEVVFRNIKYFEGLGFVKILRKGRVRIPRLKGEIRIELWAAPVERVAETA